MDYLDLVQSLHYEAQLPGSAPAAVTGQSGRAADLVRWVAEAWNDIQRDNNGRWKWLRGDFTLQTVADTADYAYTDATDVDTAAAITRFRRWDLDRRDPPHIYLVSDGEEFERRIDILDWRDFRRLYVLATHDSQYPSCVAADVGDNLWFGPTPDDIYLLSGSYWLSNQTLSADDDVPEMPVDYHMLIVYRALTKYGYSLVAQDKLQRAAAEGLAVYENLYADQAYSQFSFSTGAALA